MAKKIKKMRGDIGSRNREKLRRAKVKLDKVAAVLAAITVVLLLLIWNKPYDLSTTGANGFPALFLLVLAGVPLEILESLFRFLELPELVRACGTFPMLGCGAFTTIFVLWFVSRFIILKRYGQYGLRIAVNILQIICFWGAFQLLCYLTSFALEDSADDSLKQHLKHDTSNKK
ncbi:MAG: hypothetical protein IJW08_09275 [Lentisphaeria bacterium]|nr:hypothetical protein [Lentisphaeria bacterium]